MQKLRMEKEMSESMSTTGGGTDVRAMCAVVLV